MLNLNYQKDTIDQILREFIDERGFLSCSLLHNDGEILTSLKIEDIDNEKYKNNIRNLYEKFKLLNLFQFKEKTELISFKDVESGGTHILFNSFTPDVILIVVFKEQPQLQFILKGFNIIVERIKNLLDL